MNRRDLVSQGTLALGALAATSGLAAPKAMAADRKGSPLIGTASECIQAGEECLTHCLDLMAQGNQSMAECARQVRDMLAACRGLVTLASSGSRRLKDYAVACAKICRDCEAACNEHAHHHETCKRCMEACAACAEACEAVN